MLILAAPTSPIALPTGVIVKILNISPALLPQAIARAQKTKTGNTTRLAATHR